MVRRMERRVGHAVNPSALSSHFFFCFFPKSSFIFTNVFHSVFTIVDSLKYFFFSVVKKFIFHPLRHVFADAPYERSLFTWVYAWVMKMRNIYAAWPHEYIVYICICLHLFCEEPGYTRFTWEGWRVRDMEKHNLCIACVPYTRVVTIIN